MHDITGKTNRAMQRMGYQRRANAGARPGAIRRAVSRAGYATSILFVAWWLGGALGALPTAIHLGFLVAIFGSACCWLVALLLEMTAPLPPDVALRVDGYSVNQGRDTLGTAQWLAGATRRIETDVLAAHAATQARHERQHARMSSPAGPRMQDPVLAEPEAEEAPIELRFADLARMSSRLARIVRDAIDDVPPLSSRPDATDHPTSSASDSYRVRTTGPRYDLRILGHLADSMGRAV